MRARVLTRGTAVLVAFLAMVATVPSAQGPAAQAPAGIPELLEEVRSLRAEVNRAAGASMRMQLLLARLTLQEQRIASLDRQVGEVQEKLTAVRLERADIHARFSHVEDLMTQGTLPAEDQRQFANEAKMLSKRLAEQSALEQHLRNQESELVGAVSAEQARWMDFNTRLDELERALPARSR